jgi:hypothetical protein
MNSPQAPSPENRMWIVAVEYQDSDRDQEHMGYFLDERVARDAARELADALCKVWLRPDSAGRLTVTDNPEAALSRRGVRIDVWDVPVFTSTGWNTWIETQIEQDNPDLSRGFVHDRVWHEQEQHPYVPEDTTMPQVLERDIQIPVYGRRGTNEQGEPHPKQMRIGGPSYASLLDLINGVPGR